MQKDDYRLYKIKPVEKVGVYIDNIHEWPVVTSAADSALRIEKESNGIALNSGNLTPEKTDTSASLTYTSNKPLHNAFLQFRAYDESDTLQVQCIRAGLKKDSVVKSYTFVKNVEYDNKFMALPLYEANKIIIRLHAGEFADRTWVKNLAFTVRD